MKAIPSSFCLPSSSSEPLFSITRHIRWLRKRGGATAADGGKAFSSSSIQETLYTHVTDALVKSSRDESAEKNVYPAVVLFRFFLFLQDFLRSITAATCDAGASE